MTIKLNDFINTHMYRKLYTKQVVKYTQDLSNYMYILDGVKGKNDSKMTRYQNLCYQRL